jgi:acetyl-CoA synthetase
LPKVATNPENTLDPAVAATVVPIPPPEAFAAQAAISGMAGYHALCAQAEADYEGFWAERAREQLSWSKPFSTVLNERDAPFFTWFEDGELNASYNCLDRNVEDGKGNKVAIRFEADDVAVTTVTYHELLAKVCRLANGLQSLGVTRGRSRRHIYAYGDVDRRHRRDAGLRPHRRDPSVVFGGLSSATTCRRHAPARSCAGCCARSPRARPSHRTLDPREPGHP